MSLFYELRILLSSPSAEAWKNLLNLFSRWEENKEKEVAILYAQEHLENWKDSLRLFEDIDTNHPAWILARRLELKEKQYPFRDVFSKKQNHKGNFLAPFSHFKEIIIQKGKHKSKALQQWLESPFFPKLTELEISGLQLKDPFLHSLPCIDGSQLKILALYHNRFTAKGMKHFQTCDFPVLQELDLDENPLGPESFEILSQCSYANNLTRLCANRVMMGDKGLQWLTQSPCFSKLEWLSLSGNDFTSEAIHMICESEVLPPLVYLDMSHCPMGDRGFDPIAKSPKMKNINNLVCDHCELTVASIESLQHATFRQTLQNLHLYGNPELNSVSWNLLAQLPSFPLLRYFGHVFHSNNLEDFVAFLESDFFRSFEILMMFYGNQGNHVCKRIREAKQKSNLRYLTLQNTGISFRGMSHLNQTKNLPRLEYLLLENNQITDKAMDTFRSESFPKLKKVTLRNNPITHERRLELEKKQNPEYIFTDTSIFFEQEKEN